MVAFGLSPAGVAVATAFFALSLLPSLLPRAPYIQGLVSGITMMVGYGIGVGGHWLWSYLQIPPLTGTARRVALGVTVGSIGLALLVAVWQQVGWQNEVRTLFHLGATSPITWPVIIVVTLMVAGVILLVARSIRLLFGFFVRLLTRRMPRRLAAVLGGAAAIVVVWLLVTGLLVRGFFDAANALSSTRDGTTDPGVIEPGSSLRSGSPQSLVRWDTLGREGRRFVATGPTVEQLDAFSGGGAVEPIRVYAGLKSASTPQARADLLLKELQRTGAFQRKILVVASTTGTGWLDPAGVDPLEYLFNGDTAIAGAQYSYLPSWISLLADQDAVKRTSKVVFDTIHSYWATLPPTSRPQLYLYGLSLGAYGVESVLSSIDIINEPVDGALMSGPPFFNALHSEIETRRQPGTPPWQPIYDGGRTVRFTAEQVSPDLAKAPWGPTRIVYLQHASDPVVVFSPDLAFKRPDWLQPGQRGPDVPSRMSWIPLVTMWQVAADLPTAGSVPAGYGHVYSRRANLQAWVAMTQPPGWSDDKTQQLADLMDHTLYPGE